MSRPRKEDSLDIANKAIETTIELLRDRNTSSFSLAELAKKIGCSAPALYNHFSNKNDLLKQVRITVFTQGLTKKTNRYKKPNDDPIEQLKNGGIGYINFARHNPALYRLVYCPSKDLVEHESVDSIFKQSLEALASGIRACQSQGYAVNYDATKLAHTMWAAVHGAAILALDQHDIKNSNSLWAKANEVVETIIQLIQNSKL